MTFSDPVAVCATSPVRVLRHKPAAVANFAAAAADYAIRAGHGDLRSRASSHHLCRELMARGARKDPLYRKVNTQTHHVHHGTGGDYRTQRDALARSDAMRGAMHGKQRRGLDYTPLFRFLLSRVGSEWDSVYREAVARLDRPDPIFWLVARHEHERREMVRVGESSYFSGLYVDDAGILRIVNPDLRPEDLSPSCDCCTHTFNGVRFGSGDHA